MGRRVCEGVAVKPPGESRARRRSCGSQAGARARTRRSLARAPPSRAVGHHGDLRADHRRCVPTACDRVRDVRAEWTPPDTVGVEQRRLPLQDARASRHQRRRGLRVELRAVGADRPQRLQRRRASALEPVYGVRGTTGGRHSDGAGGAILLSTVHSPVATGLEPGGAAAPARWRGGLLRAVKGAGSRAGCRVRSCCRVHALRHVRPVDARRVHEPGVAHPVAASRHTWHDAPPDDRQVLRAGRPHDADVRRRPTRGADRRDVPRHRLGTVLVDPRGSALARLGGNDRRRAAREGLSLRRSSGWGCSTSRSARRSTRTRRGSGDTRSAWPRWSRSGTSRTSARYRLASSFSPCRLLVWRHEGRPASPGCGSWSSWWSSGRCGRSPACPAACWATSPECTSRT